MNDYEALKVGALLHDIGKWYKLVEYDKSGKHIDYGCKFIEKYGEYLKNHKLLNDDEIKVIKSLIKNHHNDKINLDETTNYLLNILKISDILSNGELIYYDKNTSSEKYINLVSIFENISLNNTEDEKDIKKFKPYDDFHKYDIIPLNVSDKSFPKNKSKSIQNYNMDEYNKYIDEVKKDAKKINNFENLLLFIQKYTWCIPSTYKREKDTGYFPDVSLYDHLKTTCAIACCLYKKNLNDNEVKKLLGELNTLSNEVNIVKNKLNNEGKDLEYINKKIKEKAKDVLKNMDIIKNNSFSLIHGDISGVQDFIFNITSKGANKSLKGRSFYLDFLTELCARYVANELKLPIANILFYGGGHFYILSHKIDDSTIENYEKEINDILFEKFGADLYVAIGKVDLRPIDFLIDCMDEDAKIGIPYKWKECDEAILKRKMRKFKYKGMELFKPKGTGGYAKKCSVCKGEYEIKNDDEKCIYCSSFEDLTKRLKDFGKNKEIKISDIKNLKIFDGFFENLDNKENSNKNRNKPLKIEFKNNIYHLPKENGDLNIPYKIWSIAFPLKEEDGKIYEFSELAEQAKERTGTNKIAILKMDVDNLGKIIKKGLGNNATISRLSTLSSMLTLFFTGYIPYLIKTGKSETVYENDEKKAKYENNIYLTYSGGDDTLIVGAWDVVWDLAKRIRMKFKEFVCNNPDITLSAGIVIVSPKFEFKKAVELADKELDRAKENVEAIIKNMDEEKENNGSKSNIKTETKEKNSVCIFNSPLNWERVKYYDKDKLKDNVKKALKGELNEFDETILEELFLNAVNVSEKRRLLHISQITANKLNEVVREQDENVLRVNIPAYWRVKYYLHRNFKDDGNELKKEVKFLEKYIDTKVRNALKNNLNKNDDKSKINFNDLRIAAKIVELKTRG
jgi:CRISPR-associated protein Csm1